MQRRISCLSPFRALLIRQCTHSHPQHLTVELRESTRIGAVDHCFFEASDHTESMSACWRQPLPLTGKITTCLAHSVNRQVSAFVRGHEKVLASGQVEVLAGGQLK